MINGPIGPLTNFNILQLKNNITQTKLINNK